LLIVLEAGRSLPPYPSLFIKPNTCLADHGDAVPIPSIAQSPLEADYEGELCVVIGKDCKNVSKEDALSYVAGYTCGDDVSTRKWQRDADRAGGVPQWCFSKVRELAPADYLLDNVL
jgi:2-keto-4-pentenoate hydratase/2-oxohepta-3-ene-1,7-dioic acid hydratase in catechol pathway